MEERKEFLKELLIYYCKGSGVFYDKKYPSIKLIDKTGEVYFIGKNRHLDMIKERIPDWNLEYDGKILAELNDNVLFKMCEGSKFDDNYTTSIMYLGE